VATVICSFSMSLDGFVALPDDGIGPLFGWHSSGEIVMRPPGYPLTMRLTEGSARHWQELTERAGAFVCGRRLFDHTRGWGGAPPMGVPTFVVTHRPPPEDWPPRPDAPFTFVTDGLESAVEQAKAAAGSGVVSVAGANVAQQCLALGLIDEVWADLVPVLLGKGIRYFGDQSVFLEDPEIIESKRTTHLRFRVRRSTGHVPDEGGQPSRR
jgi:dihydrofolate reductase